MVKSVDMTKLCVHVLFISECMHLQKIVLVCIMAFENEYCVHACRLDTASAMNRLTCLGRYCEGIGGESTETVLNRLRQGDCECMYEQFVHDAMG